MTKKRKEKKRKEKKRKEKKRKEKKRKEKKRKEKKRKEKKRKEKKRKEKKRKETNKKQNCKENPKPNFNSKLGEGCLVLPLIFDMDKEVFYTRYRPTCWIYIASVHIRPRCLEILFHVRSQGVLTLKRSTETFQFFKPPFSTKITKFTKFAFLEPKFVQNFHSKATNSVKIQIFKPYFSQNSVKPYFFPKVSSLSPYFWCLSILYAPHLGSTPIPKWKLNTPWVRSSQQQW